MVHELQAHFEALAERLFAALPAREQLLLSLSAEAGDFVRLNCGRIRQAGRVTQARLQLELLAGARHARATLELSGQSDVDLAQGLTLLQRLRAAVAVLPEDPYCVPVVSHDDSCALHPGRLPPAAEMVTAVVDAAAGADLVGLLSSGWRMDGFASSLGQRNWSATEDFQLDWSLYLQGDKAVKASWSAQHWDDRILQQRMAEARAQLAIMGRTPRVPAPGRYRVWLAPAAVAELLGMLAWGGLGQKALASGQSPLQRMRESAQRLDARIRLREDPALGLAPDFNARGERAPRAVELLCGGALVEPLIDSRSAREFGLQANALSESPRNLRLDPGGLDPAGAAAAIGEGILINNLWYLNWSDRAAARCTGMTRFASLWVEAGRPVAPIEPLRFDDSLFHIFGEGLVDLGARAERRPSLDSYGERARGGVMTPGILVDGLRFTL